MSFYRSESVNLRSLTARSLKVIPKLKYLNLIQKYRFLNPYNNGYGVSGVLNFMKGLSGMSKRRYERMERRVFYYYVALLILKLSIRMVWGFMCSKVTVLGRV